jgi:DNA modification methylase
VPKGSLLVLDPFMGSGSTAVAARMLGCDYVGFEIDPDYVSAASTTLRSVGQRPAQSKLFGQ